MRLRIYASSFVFLQLYILVRSQGDQVNTMNQRPADRNPNIINLNSHDKDHIQEHLDGMINKPESEMTEDELHLHYFKVHDYDNNNKLDGIELIQALTHYHQKDGEQDTRPVMSSDEMIEILDPIIESEDRNLDGYIDYPEYALGQKGTT